jgi:2,3-bisphosphoglycerate-independent phosphoglycerate mutase
MMITADHGNAECLWDADHQQPHTAHTNHPVPLVYLGPHRLRATQGTLCDIAPTLLHALGCKLHANMTGSNLLMG